MAAEVNEEEKNTKKMTVFVTVPRPRNPQGYPVPLKVVRLEVSSDDTVASVKATLHTMERIPPSRQRLVFACSALPDDDDMTLADHGVVDSAKIQLVETKMHVLVRYLTDPSIITIIGVESCDTVESFRLRLQEREEIRLRPKWQRILCSGHQLEDGHTLAEYGVQDYTPMSLIPRPLRMRHRVLELDIKVTDMVGRIKERVEEVEGVPVSCQRSVNYCAKELDDDHALTLDGRTLEWVNIVCRRQEKGDATKTRNKGDPMVVKKKRRADVKVTGPGKNIPAVQRRRFSAILSGPELEAICPSSCDTDPVC